MSTTTTKPMQIVMILDASGSMSSIQSDVIGSVNSFLDEEKAKKSQDLFTLIVFSDNVTTKVHKKPIKDVGDLTPEMYQIGGSTALFKAIVDTIESLKSEDNLVMVIVTDGQENCSGPEYTRKRVFDLVQKCKAEKNWTFSYLSADIDTFDQGVALGFGGIDQNNVDVSSLKHKMASCNTTTGYLNLGKQISQTTQKCVSIQKKNTANQTNQDYQTIQPEIDANSVAPSSTSFFDSVSDLMSSVGNFFTGN